MTKCVKLYLRKGCIGMDKLKLPEVPEIIGGNVIVPKTVWEGLVRYISLMQKTINAQSEELAKQSNRIQKVESAAVELAKAVGGIYNALS
mgnify:CR=1 FL=1